MKWLSIPSINKSAVKKKFYVLQCEVYLAKPNTHTYFGICKFGAPILGKFACR